MARWVTLYKLVRSSSNQKLGSDQVSINENMREGNLLLNAAYFWYVYV